MSTKDDRDARCLIDKLEKSSDLLREAFGHINESNFDYRVLYYIERILADIEYTLKDFGMDFEDVYNNTMLRENEYANDFNVFLSYMYSFSHRTDLKTLNEKLKDVYNRK